MPDSARIAVLIEKVETLEEGHELNLSEIKDLKQRLEAYDKIAVKAGAVFMAAWGLGALILTYYDKIKSALMAFWVVK